MASEKLEVGAPVNVSWCHAWKVHVSPTLTLTSPVGVGVMARSSLRLNELDEPVSWTCPRPTQRPMLPRMHRLPALPLGWATKPWVLLVMKYPKACVGRSDAVRVTSLARTKPRPKAAIAPVPPEELGTAMQ